ncbi:MAG TPA: MerR family transcriptional regulator [Pseudolabrys sp.]|nr:MerR family transcriptional regulator [Pseudolabrys sp.]
MDNKAPDAFRTISEVADDLDLPQHVLRFWESRFREIKPMKRGGGRRYYRPDDVDLLRGIRHLLYGEGYTIRGVQRILKEQGVKFVQAVWQAGAPQPQHRGDEDEDLAHDEGVVEEAETEAHGGGLRERISSLIGRDFSDDDAALGERREPPMQSAPMPRVEPADRIANPPIAPTPVQPAATPSRAPNRGLSDEDLRKLRATLGELDECRRLLEAAISPA